MCLQTWEKVGKGIKRHYTTKCGPERIPIDAVSLWTLVRDTLDPRHESIRLVKILEDAGKESKRKDEPFRPHLLFPRSQTSYEREASLLIPETKSNGRKRLLSTIMRIGLLLGTLLRYFSRTNRQG